MENPISAKKFKATFSQYVGYGGGRGGAGVKESAHAQSSLQQNALLAYKTTLAKFSMQICMEKALE